MDLVIALTINGLVWGLIVALIALGLSIIFGLLDIINVAHGDFFMVGTVLALVIAGTTGFWIALVLVPLLGLAMGLVIERLIIRPTISAASLTIVTTFGLSMILQESVRATFGAQPRRMAAPIQGTIPLFGLEYDIYRLFRRGLCGVVYRRFLSIPVADHAWDLDSGGAAGSRNRDRAWDSGGSGLRLHLRSRHGDGAPGRRDRSSRSRPWNFEPASTFCPSASWRSSLVDSEI